MTLILKDRVKETTTTVGLGTISLGGSSDTFEPFSTIGTGNTTYYAIVAEGNDNWEVGVGTVGSGTLSRDIVLASSNSNAKVNFPAGTKDVFVTLPANKIVSKDDATGINSGISLADYVDFDTAAAAAGAIGRLKWNDQDGTLDLGVKGGNVTLQVGQEQLIRVVNKAGASLLEANYQCVKISGAQGQRPKVALAQADNDLNSADTIGLVTETIANNQEGFVTTSGIVRNINTTGSLQGESWNDGDVLYLSGTTAGQITNVKPSAPTHTVIVGFVIYAHINQGKIFVKVDNGYELDELHNVNITSPSNGQVLTYNNGLWENQTNGSGTVTSVSVVSANGLSGSVANSTTTPAITLSTSVSGLLKGSAGALAAASATDVPELPQSKITNLVSDLAAKAPLASPALTGTPTAPTAAVGTNTTQVATTAFVNAEIANDAPSKTGTGASGTWGIDITGNANTVDGYHVQVDGTGTDPNTIYFKTTGGGIGVDWDDISNTPTTVAGYGITDVFTETESDARFLGISATAVNSDKVDGYHVQVDGTGTDPNTIYFKTTGGGIGVEWDDVSNTPTTIAGYGITDAVTTSGNQTVGGTKTFSSTITGSITGNAGTVTNGVYTSGDQTIGGTKTFSSTISGSIDGNSNTVDGYHVQVDGTGTDPNTIYFKTTGGGIGVDWDDISNTPTTVAGYGITDAVTTSGNQTIGGTKTFSSTITGSITGNAGTVTNGVYTTGDQTIGGTKTFSTELRVPSFAGTNSFISGTGDGASLSTYNFALSGWNGMAFYNPTVGGVFPTSTTGVVNFRDGIIEMRGSLRAPIFYDSANTSYYLDPANTGTSMVVAGDVVASNLKTSANTALSLGLYTGTAFNTGGSAISLRGSTTGYNDSGMEFYAGNSERMRINSSGNVGIGTTSPSSKLDVSNGSQSDTVNRANSSAYFYGFDVGIAVGQASASGSYGTWVQSLRASDNASFQLLLNPSGGNVGIGTNSPSSRLEASGADCVVKSSATSGYAGFYAIGSGTNNSYLFLGNTTSGEQGRITSENGGGLIFSNGSGATERMRITSAGNVGIGTSSPWEKISVPFNNGIALGSSTYSFKIQRSSTGELITTFSDTYDASTARIDFTMRSGHAAQNTPLSILGSGNVGIGTTSPGRRLSIAGGGFAFDDANVSTRSIHWGNGTTYPVLIQGDATNGFITFNTHASGSGPPERMRIDSSGKVLVGAGATASLGKLVVSEASSGTAVIALESQGSWNSQISSTSTGNMIFSNGTNERLKIDSSGNVTASVSMLAPIYYDSNNTGYYLDPTSLYSLRTVGDWRSNSDAWTGEFAGKIQYHNNTWYFQATNGWIFRNASAVDVATISNAGDLTLNGQLIVNSGDGSSYIYMADTDEGARVIHCNSNRIGFLTQAGGWGSYCVDEGDWISDMSVRAPIFYDTNNTAFYVNPNDTSNINNLVMNGFIQGRSCADTNVNTANDTGSISIRGSSTTVAAMSFHRTGAYAINMGLGTDNVFRIGGWSASNNCLQMDGSGNLTMLNNVTAYSDARLKTDVVKIENALDKVQQLNGYTYTRTDTGSKQTGVIAQEVMKVLPEVVMGSEDTHYSVAYGNMVGLLIEAIKEQQGQINELKLTIEQLKGN